MIIPSGLAVKTRNTCKQSLHYHVDNTVSSTTDSRRRAAVLISWYRCPTIPRHLSWDGGAQLRGRVGWKLNVSAASLLLPPHNAHESFYFHALYLKLRYCSRDSKLSSVSAQKHSTQGVSWQNHSKAAGKQATLEAGTLETRTGCQHSSMIFLTRFRMLLTALMFLYPVPELLLHRKCSLPPSSLESEGQWHSTC